MSEEFEFHDAHRPVLASGDYSVSVSWKVFVDDAQQDAASETTSFHVASERFSLKPADVQSVYPPEGSQGAYGRCLPQVLLTRDTLPWERSAKNGSDAPWLALLLTEAEAAVCKPRMMQLSEYRRIVPLSPEPGEADADPLQVIDVPAAVVHAAVPTLAQLPLLCHARVSKKESVSVVVGKRQPGPGRNTVHLVVLENRYPDLETRYLGANMANQPSCALVSLKSWSFTSDAGNAAPSETLGKLLKEVNASWLQLPEITPYEDFNFVPLQHRFRTGESSASWYAGPLAAGRSIAVDPTVVPLPAKSADELLWYDPALRMLKRDLRCGMGTRPIARDAESPRFFASSRLAAGTDSLCAFRRRCR